ncbi:MAG: hypothetical protein ACRDF0_05645 [Candidatus Limnocylindria bacterium]
MITERRNSVDAGARPFRARAQGRRIALAVAGLVLAVSVGAVALTRQPDGSAVGEGATGVLRPSTSEGRATAFPDVPLLAGTASGRIYRLSPSGVAAGPLELCGGRAVLAMRGAPSGNLALAVCDRARGSEGSDAFVIDVRSLAAQRIDVTVLPRNDVVAWSPDARKLAVIAPGACVALEPVCRARAVVYDIAAATATQIHPDEPRLADIRWTSSGISLYKPAAAKAGGSAGTYLLSDGRWLWIAPDRLVDEFADRAILRRVDAGVRERSSVVERSGGRERVLTPDGESEWPLILLEDGSVAAWRLGEGTRGTLVVYREGAVVRARAGTLAPVAQGTGAWIVARDIAGEIHAYSLGEDRFATWPGSLGEPITAIAVTGGR